MKIQIAKSPCYPPYSVVVGEEEYWDSDCASSTIGDVLERAAEEYPGEEIIMFNDPRHYSQRSKK